MAQNKLLQRPDEKMNDTLVNDFYLLHYKFSKTWNFPLCIDSNPPPSILPSPTRPAVSCTCTSSAATLVYGHTDFWLTVNSAHSVCVCLCVGFKWQFVLAKKDEFHTKTNTTMRTQARVELSSDCVSLQSDSVFWVFCCFCHLDLLLHFTRQKNKSALIRRH